MRLAILSDIHGNLPAFESALQDAARHSPDQIIIGGDVINGSPDSAACWQLAQSLGCPVLRGNHERYAAPSARRWLPRIGARRILRPCSGRWGS